ncbi:cholesteryl ester transfer protein isoform X4 [Mobula hypostoma]|uniref:cholesteryl ester transfer protein isoform X4 n=1 Tax=Mobula hypostoma TaxID=723540 RepID=UPI002FC3506F
MLLGPALATNMFPLRQLSPVLFLLAGASLSCHPGPPASSMNITGIVCRFSKEAALIFNQETSDVIQATFRHASFPDMAGEKSILMLGTISYVLKNLQIMNMSVESSDVELSNEKGILISIENVAATIKGNMNYAYSNWLLQLNHSLDFEIQSQTDVDLALTLGCDNGRIEVTISDCLLNFDKLSLQLQKLSKISWIKQLLTDFVSFTLRHVLKGQICAEIHKMANLLSDFTLKQAGIFIRDGEISTSTELTGDPVITSGYVESQHKGSVFYRNLSVFQKPSVIPVEREETRMFSLWVSEAVINSLLFAAYHEDRLTLKLEDNDLLKVFEDGEFENVPNILQQDIETTVQSSYANRKIQLWPSSNRWSIKAIKHNPAVTLDENKANYYLENFFSSGGLQNIMSYVEFYITALLDKKGLHYFNVTNTVLEPSKGYMLVATDFHFPRQLLESFLQNLTSTTRS